MSHPSLYAILAELGHKGPPLDMDGLAAGRVG
jgi:hypothetical protein